MTKFVNNKPRRNRTVMIAFVLAAIAISMGPGGPPGAKKPTKPDAGKRKVIPKQKLPSGPGTLRLKHVNLRGESPLARNASGARSRSAGNSRPTSPRSSGSQSAAGSPRVVYSGLPANPRASFNPSTASRRSSVILQPMAPGPQPVVGTKLASAKVTKFRRQQFAQTRAKVDTLSSQVATARANIQSTRTNLAKAQDSRRQSMDLAAQARAAKRQIRPGWNPLSARNRQLRAQQNVHRANQTKYEVDAKGYTKEVAKLSKQVALQRKALKPVETKWEKMKRRNEYFKTQLRNRSGVPDP